MKYTNVGVNILVINIILFFSAGGNGITSPNAVGVLQWVPLWDNAAFLLLDKVNKKLLKKTQHLFLRNITQKQYCFLFFTCIISIKKKVII